MPIALKNCGKQNYCAMLEKLYENIWDKNPPNSFILAIEFSMDIQRRSLPIEIGFNSMLTSTCFVVLLTI